VTPFDATASAGPRLVVVPGLGLDAASWAPVLPYVQAHVEAPVEVRTLPGYGRGARRDADLSPATLGAGLGDDLRGGPTTVLVGHSSGCQVAAHAARAAGPSVVGLVLVGPTTDPRGRGWPALAGRWLRTAVHESPRLVPGLVRQYRQTRLRVMARAMDAARRDDLRTALAGEARPVLVVRGPQDRICPQDWAERLASWCVTLPGGAHMVPCTHGPDLAEALTRFVGAVPREA
jgi:pimeloyl-ACP methyl ester carboxylesterase